MGSSAADVAHGESGASEVKLEARETAGGVEKGSRFPEEAVGNGVAREESEEFLIDFEGPTEPSNPTSWCRTYQRSIVEPLSAVNLIA